MAAMLITPGHAKAVPKENDYVRTVRPSPVIVVYSWDAPFTSGQDAELPAEVLVSIVGDILPGAEAASCRPVHYEKWEQVLVEESVRASSGYVGYTVVIPLSAFENDCYELQANK